MDKEKMKDVKDKYKTTEDIKQLREEGEITAEEAKEKSPVGWYNCGMCDWDGAFAPVNIKDTGDMDKKLEVRCPECGAYLSDSGQIK